MGLTTSRNSKERSFPDLGTHKTQTILQLSYCRSGHLHQ
ncbi:hypothetical protein A2U01_0083112, partial [Trifolium medium]|nr:hypothetical protein [Trifolium medium]